jgi:hypothetical protein
MGCLGGLEDCQVLEKGKVNVQLTGEGEKSEERENEAKR